MKKNTYKISKKIIVLKSFDDIAELLTVLHAHFYLNNCISGRYQILTQKISQNYLEIPEKIILKIGARTT